MYSSMTSGVPIGGAGGATAPGANFLGGAELLEA